jgi:opacity protein-like surface antigen
MGTILVNQSTDECWPHAQIFVNFFNGVVLKRNFNQLSVRFATEYVTRIYKRGEVSGCDWVYTEGYENEGMARVGVEKGLINKKRFNSYFALDLAYVRSFADIYVGGGYDGTDSKVITKTSGLGAIPSLGIEYKLTKTLSVNLETRGRLIYSNITSDLERIGDGRRTHYQNKEWVNTFNGIGAFTLNFNF